MRQLKRTNTMKRLLAALLVLMLSIAVFMPSTLASATDNVTSVAADNTIQGTVDRALAALIGMVIIILMVVLAFWHRDPIMYVLAGFSFILYGFTLWTTSWYLSILLVVAGMGLFIKAGIDRKKKK